MSARAPPVGTEENAQILSTATRASVSPASPASTASATSPNAQRRKC